MQELPSGQFAGFQNRVYEYLPTLAAGLLVVALGVGVGWLAKRATVRALIWLRLDRLGGQRAWRAALYKGAVRSALYNIAGNVVMALVVLVFLDNALEIWGLVVLSRLVTTALVYLPNLALVALIAGVGLVLANTMAGRVEAALEEEDLPRARVVAKVFKGTLLFIVGALALWELEFAREIVLAAFLIAFGAVGLAFALAAGIGGARAIQHVLQEFLARGGKSRD